MTTKTQTPTFCTLCGAHCSANVTVEDGKIVKWEQDKESGLHYLPCRHFKGKYMGEFTEGPDRLKYPLKRIGARGEGKWQRISWDEAMDTIATKFTEVKEQYGPAAIGAAVGEPKGFEFPWLQRFASAFGTPNVSTPLAV